MFINLLKKAFISVLAATVLGLSSAHLSQAQITLSETAIGQNLDYTVYLDGPAVVGCARCGFTLSAVDGQISSLIGLLDQEFQVTTSGGANANDFTFEYGGLTPIVAVAGQKVLLGDFVVTQMRGRPRHRLTIQASIQARPVNC